jgi:hypothetical protein
MRVAVITLLTLAALAGAQRCPAAGTDSPGPVKASSLAPRPALPGRVYGSPIEGPILHKRVRKKPSGSTALKPIS